MTEETCAFCSRTVRPNDPQLAEYVSGWVERRRGGGAHGVRLKSLPTKLAHQACLDREVRLNAAKLAREQGSFRL